jgi:sarcosine oxidase subunit alpha
MPRLPTHPEDVTFTFDGRAVPGRAGEPVTVALLAAGIPLLGRSPKYHRPRGPFCLAGTCGTCFVRADGEANVRACRLPVEMGLAVESQNAFPDARHDLLAAIDRVYPDGLDHHHLMTAAVPLNKLAVAASRKLAGYGVLGAHPPARPEAGPEERFDALVVGAGPAGLAAAAALAARGRRVLVADQEARIGGRLRARLDAGLDLAWAGARAREVTAAGGEVALATAVLGLWIDHGAVVAVLHAGGEPGRLRRIRPGGTFVCAGGAIVPPALENGDVPGVFSGRALGAALAEHGALAGSRLAVLGAGAEAEALAGAFRAAGAGATLVAPGEARGLSGRARVSAVRLEGRGTVPCDAVAVALPPVPLPDLARALGAEVALDPATGGFGVRAGADGSTGVPGLFAAGEVTGTMDAARAAEMGRRAGEAAP